MYARVAFMGGPPKVKGGAVISRPKFHLLSTPLPASDIIIIYPRKFHTHDADAVQFRVYLVPLIDERCFHEDLFTFTFDDTPFDSKHLPQGDRLTELRVNLMIPVQYMRWLG